MTVAELITELGKWPKESDVTVCRQIIGIGGDFAYPILEVTGAAGGAIDGRDSSVVLEIPATAYDETIDP